MMIGELKQVGFVFKDISSVINKISDLFDLTDLKMTDVNITKDINGNDIGPIKLKIASKTFGPTTIEFIQVIEGTTVFDDFLDKNDGGFHHVVFFVNDLNEEIEKLEAQGLKQIFNAVINDKKVVLFNTRSIFGHDTMLKSN
ncbi:MAG: VOC family protein [Candidatus Helarchaeota archaeon]